MSGETRNSRAQAAAYVAGQSGPAAEFEAQLRKVALSPATVLLQGESGSGKSRAARRLHDCSSRSEGPFVEVSISALSAGLIEAELFGHEEGAFTGADRARSGRFLRADGGTLLLEGIENLSSDVQVKLLRVLQERVVEPLGGLPKPIDVRVLATTSVDLESRVAAGDFREDLYYRLAVVTLGVPPLRSRMGELPELVESLAKGVAERAGVSMRSFSGEALEEMSAHGWPGNLRELENAVERVLVLGGENHEAVQPSELSFLRQEVRGEAHSLARQALAQGLTVDAMGLAMIEEAVEEQRGNLSAAARQVGLSRRALEYRLKRSQEEGEESPEEGADVQ